jgi:hypothetical protein
MTSAQRVAIGTPATGLMVYQTDGTAGFYYYNGSSWVLIQSGTSGNGIYSGSGVIPSTTTATMTDTFAFNNGGGSIVTFGGSGASSGLLELEVPTGSNTSIAMYENRVGGASTGDSQNLNFYFNDSLGAKTLGASIIARVEGSPTAGDVKNGLTMNGAFKVQENERILITPNALTAAATAHVEIRGDGTTPNTGLLVKSGGATASQIPFWVQSSTTSLSYIDGVGKWFHNVSQISTADFNARGLTDVNLLYVDASVDRIGIGEATPDAKLHIVGNGSTSATSSFLIQDSGLSPMFEMSDDGHIAQNTTPSTTIQNYLLGDSSAYGFRVDGTNTSAHYGSNGGGNTAAFYCFNFDATSGVQIEGNTAITSNRTGGRFHVYGANTGQNNGITIRSENGASNSFGIELISGRQIFRSGNNYGATSTLTQKGSDGALQFNSSLWNGASASNFLFEIQSVASTVTNELTNLDFFYDGTEVLSITSNEQVGIGTTLPTASLHLRGGTATANTSSLKFDTGTLLAVAETGAMEFASDFFYLTANSVRTAISTFGRTVDNVATYTVLITDRIIGVTRTTTGTATVNLPSASLFPSGYQITIMDEGLNATTNNITIDASAAQTINGNLTEVINVDGDSRTLYSNGVDGWFIM